MRNSREYYERRLVQAKSLADRADDPSIKRPHLEMAERYRRIVDGDEDPDGRALHRIVMNQVGG